MPSEGLAFLKARHKDASPPCLLAPQVPSSLNLDSSEGQRWHITVLMSDGRPGLPSAQCRMCVSLKGHLVMDGPILSCLNWESWIPLSKHQGRCLWHPGQSQTRRMAWSCLSLFSETVLKYPDKKQLGDKGFFLLPIPGYSYDGWGSQGRGLKQRPHHTHHGRVNEHSLLPVHSSHLS